MSRAGPRSHDDTKVTKDLACGRTCLRDVRALRGFTRRDRRQRLVENLDRRVGLLLASARAAATGGWRCGRRRGRAARA